jgi:hypothetical protein
MDRQLIYPEECYAMRGAIYEVYRELGNGFREEVYQQQAWSARQFRRISQSRCRAVDELMAQFFMFFVCREGGFRVLRPPQTEGRSDETTHGDGLGLKNIPCLAKG